MKETDKLNKDLTVRKKKDIVDLYIRGNIYTVFLHNIGKYKITP